ncbi:thioesterase II family protein [Paenibacillus alvei]|uniref:Thioesterase n=1 Tax=Paenibacillus alvei TaxID=44250 RepID=A0A383R9U2_PAEAL
MSEINKIKVFPIPYAGASVNVFYEWKKLLPDRYELFMSELAGRGTRFREPCYQSVGEASEDIINLGKWELRNQGICFFSGRNAPHIFEEREDIENMTNETFLQKVEQYGGIPEEFYIKALLKIKFGYIRNLALMGNGFKIYLLIPLFKS